MPNRILDHDEELELDLRMGHMRRQMSLQRLPKPLNQLGARGALVPHPGPGAQGAVVKLWSAKPSTTKGHVAYLSRGKGIDGADAEVFGRAVHGLGERANDDTHQIRGMISLDADHALDLKAFVTRLMGQVERDVGVPLDWASAVHHDTDHVHAHVLIRGRDLDGKELYFTKHYWAYGLKYRTQALATAYLGRVPSETSAMASRVLGYVRERLAQREIQHGRVL